MSSRILALCLAIASSRGPRKRDCRLVK
jgi:hypothetical protein